jgi:hypothetical protein
MITLNQESSIALRHAILNGVVDTDLSAYPNQFMVNLLSKWAPKQVRDRSRDPNTFEPFENSQSLRWQEDILSAATHSTVTEYFAVELARFTVPKGQTGFLKHIDQVLNDVEGSYYPSNVAYWGSPTFVIPDVDNCRWYITIDFFDGQLPGRFTLSSATPFGSEVLPGEPYPDLYEIPGLWYPAHCNRTLKLIVPGARMLRLFFYTPPTTVYQWQCSGRLAGYTQSTYSDFTTNNARIFR